MTEQRTYTEAIPIVYRKVKEQGKPINILVLTRKMKQIAETKNPDFTDKLIDTIVQKILDSNKKK